MQNLTPEGLRVVTEAAKRHGVSPEAAAALLGALAQGHGRQAQFNHPELGGMGQWSQGGMIMIGDMFNSGLKARVDALCNELAGFLRSQPPANVEAGGFPSPGGSVSLFAAGAGAAGPWWPAGLGSPASTGAQNDLRYAYFPGSRRLAIQQGGEVRIYDAGEHRISGFSQQQSGDRSLTFTSQHGLVRIADLAPVFPEGDQTRNPSPPQAPRHEPPAARPTAAPTPAAPQATDDILKTIERLAELRQKDVLTAEEFAAKKAELLGRL
jgi:Short C-terminal domain